MMRQISKNSLTICTALAIVCALAVPALTPLTALAAVSAQKTILTDPLTGVALGGYDVLSYFTESVPVVGRPEFALEWGGTTWYFASPANRDVFKRHPEVYTPEFGGYCAMSIARGYLSDGNPRIYAVLANHLFLFYSLGNRDAFLMSPRGAYERGVEQWPTLEKNLVP